MTAKIFAKLLFGVLCVLILALISVDYLASRVAESAYLDTLRRELEDKGKTLALVLPDSTAGKPDSARFVQLAHAAGVRLTVIAPNGQVVSDSEAKPERMENHRNRPEVLSALNGQAGSSIRQSPTIGVPFLYVALPIPNGALRLAVPLAEIHQQVNDIRRRMLISVAIAFLPIVFIAAFFARYVSSRLGEIIEYSANLAMGNFKTRLARTGSDELGTLSAKLNETGEKLRDMFEALEREHTELEKLERVRKDFVINVSHELRTPLASIQGYTETLLDGALHDPHNNMRFLNIIRQNAERLSALTADLLSLSRIELKQQKFQFASYNLRTLVEDSVLSIQPLTRRKAIQLEFKDDGRRPEAFCDKEAVSQVLSNLLDNAIKYTPESGRIEVGIRDAGPFVQIYVRDSGIGIPLEDQPRLFERFYRVDKARSRELGGTGLGLAIVKHLVRAQGGEVTVSSRPGEGSEFAFTLPVEDMGLSEQSDICEQLTPS